MRIFMCYVSLYEYIRSLSGSKFGEFYLYYTQLNFRDVSPIDF